MHKFLTALAVTLAVASAAQARDLAEDKAQIDAGLDRGYAHLDALYSKLLPQYRSVLKVYLGRVDPVFSDADRRRYVEGLATVLKPAGRVFLLCFGDEEPGTQGPRRVSQEELHAAFAEEWMIESIEPSATMSGRI